MPPEFGEVTLDKFVDSLGRPLPQRIRTEIVQAILRAVEHPDSDITAVVKAAQTIARRALDGEIRDVLRYATKALFSVSRKRQLLSVHQTLVVMSPTALIPLAGEAIEGSANAIEAGTVIKQLLEGLSTLEREVFVRYTMAWKHARIAEDLNISIAMSSYYLQRARARLRAKGIN
jgi:DNA-directed RNA polymerase specialized sigma subunit